MNVFLAANQQNLLRGDVVVRLVQRSDLAPVPRNVELSVRNIKGVTDTLGEGVSFWTGRENLEYTIVKVDGNTSSAFVQGGSQMGVTTYHALLASCAQIGYRRPTAVVKEGKTFGECFRACGATAQVGNDFPVARFTCLKGQIPSFELARALQEECGALVLTNGQLMIKRLPDLFTQTPVANMQSDTSIAVDSEFLERHEIPSFFSVDPTGAFIQGNFNATRAVQFVPGMDVRQLWNMSRVLVQKRKVNSTLASNINAGDLINIAGTNYAVITTVNEFRQENGATQSDSTAFLGRLSA